MRPRKQPDLTGDPNYWSRNSDIQARFSNTIVVDPASPKWMWGFYLMDDPGNQGLCSTGTNTNDVEIHRTIGAGGQLVPSGIGVERHCIRPGRFTIKLQSPLGSTISNTTRQITFLSADKINNVLVENLGV
jgi:hypothetical protein